MYVRPNTLIAFRTDLGRILIVLASVANECPLYPQKRTLAAHAGMSALCQKRTLAAIRSHGAAASEDSCDAAGKLSGS